MKKSLVVIVSFFCAVNFILAPNVLAQSIDQEQLMQQVILGAYEQAVRNVVAQTLVQQKLRIG